MAMSSWKTFCDDECVRGICWSWEFLWNPCFWLLSTAQRRILATFGSETLEPHRVLWPLEGHVLFEKSWKDEGCFFTWDKNILLGAVRALGEKQDPMLRLAADALHMGQWAFQAEICLSFSEECPGKVQKGPLLTWQMAQAQLLGFHRPIVLWNGRHGQNGKVLVGLGWRWPVALSIRPHAPKILRALSALGLLCSLRGWGIWGSFLRFSRLFIKPNEWELFYPLLTEAAL